MAQEPKIKHITIEFEDGRAWMIYRPTVSQFSIITESVYDPDVQIKTSSQVRVDITFVTENPFSSQVLPELPEPKQKALKVSWEMDAI